MRIRDLGAHAIYNAIANRETPRVARVQPGTIKATADGSKLDVYIYGEIGFWGIEAIDVAGEIATSEADEIVAHINSPGGDVFDGVAIFNLLRHHRANVTTRVEGLAASIASLITIAGDSVEMAGSSMYMVHEVWTVAVGNKRDMREAADTLERIEAGTILPAYAAKTGKTDDEVKALVEAETWLDVAGAIEAGFVDAEYTGEAPKASLAPEVANAFGFRRVPESLAPSGENPPPTEGGDPVARLKLFRARTRAAELVA